MLHDQIEILRGAGDAQLLHGDRQIHRVHEAHELLDLCQRGVFNDHLGDQGEGHLLAVEGLLPAGGLGEAGVDAVPGSQAAVDKADAAEQGVGLDDVLHGLGHGLCLDRFEGGHAVLHQDVIAFPGHGHGGTGGAVAAGDAVGRGGALAGQGLKPGGQRVADAGGEEPGRSLGNDLGVHQHKLRAAAGPAPAQMHPLGGVDGGPVGCRSVAGGGGGRDDAGLVHLVRHKLGGVQHLAAAHAHQDVTAVSAHQGGQLRHGLHAGFTGEAHSLVTAAGLVLDRGEHGENHLINAAVDQEQETLPILTAVVKDVPELTGALNIPLRAAKSS